MYILYMSFDFFSTSPASNYGVILTKGTSTSPFLIYMYICTCFCCITAIQSEEN